MQLSDQSTFNLKVLIIKLESSCDQMLSNMFFTNDFDDCALVELLRIVLAFAWPKLLTFLYTLFDDVTRG
jgi:hypothetical protein